MSDLKDAAGGENMSHVLPSQRPSSPLFLRLLASTPNTEFCVLAPTVDHNG